MAARISCSRIFPNSFSPTEAQQAIVNLEYDLNNDVGYPIEVDIETRRNGSVIDDWTRTLSAYEDYDGFNQVELSNIRDGDRLSMHIVDERTVGGGGGGGGETGDIDIKDVWVNDTSPGFGEGLQVYAKVKNNYPTERTVSLNLMANSKVIGSRQLTIAGNSSKQTSAYRSVDWLCSNKMNCPWEGRARAKITYASDNAVIDAGDVYGPSITVGKCSRSSDCPDGYVCTGGKCVPSEFGGLAPVTATTSTERAFARFGGR